MAKPHNGLPGCSGHIHVSLQDSNGRNIFALEEGKTRDDAKWADLKYVSKECGEWSSFMLILRSDVEQMSRRMVLGWSTGWPARYYALSSAYNQWIQASSRKVSPATALAYMISQTLMCRV